MTVSLVFSKSRHFNTNMQKMKNVEMSNSRGRSKSIFEDSVVKSDAYAEGATIQRGIKYDRAAFLFACKVKVTYTIIFRQSYVHIMLRNRSLLQTFCKNSLWNEDYVLQ